MTVREVEASAKRYAEALAKATDAQLAEEFVRILSDPNERDFAPYLVTHLREQGQWERLSRALIVRRRRSS